MDRPRAQVPASAIVPLAMLIVLVGWIGVVKAHIFIPLSLQAGIAPCYPGNGWTVEVFWDIPTENATNVIIAERYVADKEPTFTFRARYLDWPAGPVSHGHDADFATLGDFLNDHITEISNPNALDWPFDRHFLLRAKAYLKVRLEDSTFNLDPGVWLDYGLAAFDGGRVAVGDLSVFRILLPPRPDGFFTENSSFPLAGAYPLIITYFQRYDPNAEVDAELAGFEFTTCHEGGLPLPSGEWVFCRAGVDGAATPPELLYDLADVLPLVPGDYDADMDIDLRDAGFFQRCYTGPDPDEEVRYECEILDFDVDQDIDLDDLRVFLAQLEGPGGC
jgi:hypothetical protein